MLLGKLVTAVTNAVASPASTASTNVICEVGPCPCGTYLKAGCNPAKGCASMCVGINH